MLDATKIGNKLYGLTGLRQPINPDYAKLDAANQISRSGLFVTDIDHAKIEYLYDNQDFQGLSDAEFNTWLMNKQKQAINNVANAVFNRTDYIDRNLLFIYPQNKANVDALPDGFVGYRIQVSKVKNIAFEIKRVLLDFVNTGETIDLQLYSSSNLSAPILTETVTIDSDHKEHELNWVIDNSGDYYKEEYYFGYRTQGLTTQPYRREFNAANVQSNITHLCIEQIEVAGHNVDTLFDLEDVDGLSSATGLNPDIMVYEDYTDLMVQNERLFARAIYLEFGIICLSQYISSLRSNRNQRNAEDISVRVLQTIEGQNGDGLVKITGLRPELFGAIERIRKEIEKLQDGYFGEGMIVTTMS